MTVNGTTINNSSYYDITLTSGNAFSGGGSIFNNSGSLTLHADGGTVTFNLPLNDSGIVSAESGTLILASGGTISGTAAAAAGAVLQFASTFTFTDGASFFGEGLIQFNNNTTTNLSGTILNNGHVLLNSTGNFTDLVLSGDVTFTGSGIITLSNAARIRGSGTFTNAGNTIQGEANNSGSGLGANQIGIVNQAGGVIDANVPSGTLNVDPGSGGLANQGLMRASNGGFLLLNGNGGGAFSNTGGTISALDGSEVQLTNGASITGGILNTVGTGLIRTLNSASLTDLTNAGALRVTNNTSLTLIGTINNTASITLNSLGNFTDLVINSDVTLIGGGVINIANAGRVRGSGTLFIGGLSGETQTIQGEGNNSGSGLGANELTIVNRSGGLVDANLSGQVLNVDPGGAGLTNEGVLRASNGGLLLLNGNGSQAFDNTAGVIEALDGSQVQLTNGVLISGGTLTTAGSGTLRTISSATLDSLTIAGSFIANNNTSTTFTGTITSTGSILLDSLGNFTDLIISGNVTLTGGSTLTLKDAARIRGGGTLFIGGSGGEAFTIQGEANNSGSGLGANELTVVNRSGGLVDANVATNTLNVDPGSGGLTNQGVLRASNGGFLLLNGNGGGAFSNTGGTISALDGSEVQLTNGASITGGILNTVGTGLIRTLNSASLTDLTNAGALRVTNNTSLTLIGTINNTASITLNSLGNFTDLVINSDVTLIGGGVINIANAGRVRGSGTLFIGGLSGETQTIQGEGNNSGSGLGANELTIVNRSGGLVDANLSGQVLNVDPGGAGLTNEGVLRASNGGLLLLNGNGSQAFDNTAGVIEALDGSQVQLTNGVLISGGTLTTAGSGTLRTISSATLDSLTIAGSFIANNNTSTTFTGTITSTGSILLDSLGNFTDLIISGNVTLTGGSTLTLKDAARIRGGGTLFIGGSGGEAFTIQGEANNSGSGLGANELTVVNRSGGLVDANVATNTLNVDPGSGGLTNQGVLQASNGGFLLLNGNGGGAFSNTGTIKALTGGALQVTGTVTSTGTVDVGSDTLSITGTGTYTQTAGTFRVAGGTVTSSTALNFQGGLVDARGTINAAISNSANLQPALGGTGLTVNGAVTLLSPSKLTFQLGGLAQGNQYGFLNVNGSVALNGNLVVSFVNGFQAGNNDNFTALSSTTTLSGAFINVASGGRLTTTDNSGNFLVTYNGSTVVLSDFQVAANGPASGTADSSGQTAGNSAVAPASASSNTLPRTGTAGGRNAAARARAVAINLENSDQLLGLLERSGAKTANGKVTVSTKGGTKTSPRRGSGDIGRHQPNDSSHLRQDRRINRESTIRAIN